ncbi:MAG: helix-turn-helix transcriptional regulator [Eubacteriales bacterium]|nr:helix-turn-helix transcriptional regulator [Eubacteriales bacterium]
MCSFTKRLAKLKLERNLLQKTIADNINVSLRAYQYYERGQREPQMSVLIALADYFDVSIDYLVGRTNNPRINK